MEQLDLNKLRLFIQVVESGSLTKAAAALRQPKSRVSRHIADLEANLNAQLLYRTTRKIQLTEHGRLFYEAAQKQIKELEELRDRFSGSAQKIEGLIRITAPTDLGGWCLPAIIDDFVRMYPKVEFEVLLSQQIMDLVAEGIDVALRIANLKDSTLRVTKIAEIDSVLVASPQFLERHEDIHSLSQLPKLPCLDFLLPRKGQWGLFKTDNEEQIVTVYPKLAANDPVMVRDLVRAGHGISLLPEFLVREDLHGGKLVHILKPWMGRSAPLHVVLPGQKEVPLRVKTFRDFLIRQLKKQF